MTTATATVFADLMRRIVHERPVADVDAGGGGRGHFPRRRKRGRGAAHTTVGKEVDRYLRALAWEGKSPTTRRSYESVLTKLALDHHDAVSLETFASPVGTEYLREFLERHWGHASTATRAQRLAVVRSFFKWAVEEGRCSYNPAAAIRAPRVRSRERHAYGHETITRLIALQASLRDQCALELLALMALRKNELRLLQISDIDLTRNLLIVHGKGDKVAILPLAYARLRADLSLHIAEDHRLPDEYLVYPKLSRLRPMDPASLHRWFKRCLERADLPDSITMHEMRHTAADTLWRVTGNLLLAQELLRHESVGTTQAYLHPTREDLAAGMRAVEESWS